MTMIYQPQAVNLERFRSVHATRAATTTSARYGFIPTSEVIAQLERAGFIPVRVQQARVRLEERQGFQKHVLRFRHRDHAARVGDSIPEIVIINSHDGSSAYKIMAGVYRLVCANGLIVGSSFAEVSVRHTKNAADDIVDASFRVVGALPAIQDGIQTMRDTRLEEGERQAFATAALTLRYPTASPTTPAPIRPAQLLAPRRSADYDSNLWTTLNVVQESLIKGGQRRQDATRHRTRKITGVSEDVRINRALWTLAEEMQKLKA